LIIKHVVDICLPVFDFFKFDIFNFFHGGIMSYFRLLSILSLFLITHNVQAATLNLDTYTPLPGITAALDPTLAGTVVQDVLTPFSFSAYGGTVSGQVQNRVVLSADGGYDFYWRVFNDATSAGPIQDLRLGNFITGPTYNANYRIDGLGDAPPTQAYLFSKPGGFVNFNFINPTGGSDLAAGKSSMFFFIDTNATSYGKIATYDLTNLGQTQISGQYATFAPAVPEPETYAMLLAGLGLIGVISFRRKNDSSDMPMAA
jgi:hypothetical protein